MKRFSAAALLLVSAVAMAGACSTKYHNFNRPPPPDEMVEACLVMDDQMVANAARFEELSGPVACAGANVEVCIRRCRAGNLRACSAMASFQLEAGDEACGVRLLTYACQDGFSNPCGRLARLYFLGRGVERDHKRAFDMANQSCMRQSGLGCRIASLLEPNATLSTEYVRMACDIGDPVGCMMYADRLRRGDGVEMDAQRADELLTETCWQFGEQACVVAVLRSIGKADDPKAVRQVVKHVEGLCQAADENCGLLAYVLLQLPFRERDYDAIFALAEKGCDAGGASACYWAGELIRTGRREPYDANAILELWQRGCSLGAAGTCFEVAEYPWGAHRLEVDTEAAMRQVVDACELDPSSLTCPMLSRHKLASGSPSIRRHWQRRLARQCDRGFVYDCFELLLHSLSDETAHHNIANGLIRERSRPMHLTLGVASLSKRAPAEAIEHFDDAIKTSRNPDLATIPAAWIVAMQSLDTANETTTARSAAVLQNATQEASEWHALLARYALSSLDEQVLLDAAVASPDPSLNRERLSEAAFLVGLRHFSEGRSAEAKLHLEKTVHANVVLSLELVAAKGLLRQL